MTTLGDSALLVESADLSVTVKFPPGVLDIVPAFGLTAVHFDPTRVSCNEVCEWVTRHDASNPLSVAPSRIVRIPVAYGGDFGPDLDLVAQHAGLTADEVVRRHTATEYTVGAVGFQPGFGYLEGLPSELHTPRRATPRTAVLAGAVGIGGPYTGVYPEASPGGWNLLGRTPLTMFDATRAEPSLMQVDDRVRFVAVGSAEFQRLAEVNQPTRPIQQPVVRPLLRVVSPGVQATLQGLGDYGRQHLGVSPGGAMDTASLRLANLLAGNQPHALVIEATLIGPVLEAIEPTTLAIAGAVPAARCVTLRAGELLDLRRLVGGARAFVALPGGFVGRAGQALAAQDQLGSVGAAEREPSRHTLAGAGWKRTLDGVATLHVLRGPQAVRFDKEAWRRFLSEPYRVSPMSSRMGVRLEGPELRPNGVTNLPSQPVVTGAVQVPADGQPIVLGADRQTLGGYPVIAAVVSADWPLLGQLAPGETVRFAEVTLEVAVSLRKKRERNLALAAFGLQSYLSKK